jgi:hypothetical protein
LAHFCKNKNFRGIFYREQKIMEIKFKNIHSVKFNVYSFALPVNENIRKKNTIFTDKIENLKGGKYSLMPNEPEANNYGYSMIAKWQDSYHKYVFGLNGNGIFYATDTSTNFMQIFSHSNLAKIIVVGNRLFTIPANSNYLRYTTDLETNVAFEPERIYIPADYGNCLDLRLYRGKLLLVCGNGLLILDENLKIKHLTDNNEIIIKNLDNVDEKIWESNWFSLGYATNTQILQDVFLSFTGSGVNVTLDVSSNKVATKTVPVQSKVTETIQRLRLNLRGNQFKLKITVNGNENFVISNLSAVIKYGS